MSIPQALALAVQHHQAGRLADAEALYRQILAAQPNHPEALHLLGLIAHQSGRHDIAADLIRQAIALHPNFPDAYCNLGEVWRAAGRLDNAVAAFRRALELQPGNPEAHNNLGAALAQGGKLDEAIVAFRRALELKSDFPDALKNLGIALRRRGQLDEAAIAYRHALQLKPDYPEALHNLGIVLMNQGQFEEAIAAYRRALEIKPDYPQAHNNLGAALRERGQFDDALAAYRRAIELKPDYPEAQYNLGNVLMERGQFAEAITSFRRALEIKPDYPQAHNNLGAALRERGQFDDALAAYRRALELKPDYSEAHNNLGNALRERGQLDGAIAAYRHALESKPDYPEGLSNLGNALRERGQLDEAIDVCGRALALKPDFPEARNNLGNALMLRGELDEAIAAYHRALESKPNFPEAHSNLIFALRFRPDRDERAISDERLRWNRQFGDPLKPFILPHANNRNPERRLCIGYVSPDLRDHPVGRYLLPLLERHNREQIEVLCYSGVERSDWMTERLRALAGKWRNTAGVSDTLLADTIREDGVDILVDLTMHGARNRLPIFAREPAPVQVTWLAYPGSTGLSSIGYRLTDSQMDPPGETFVWSAEEPVRLPDCWCCYQPAGESPEVNALPALSAEGATFGSLNSFAKVHAGVLTLWARVLDAVKGSKLLMLCPEGRARERVWEFLGQRGIRAERVEFVSNLPRLEYLRLYWRIDLALDPLPCNGMTTTCDALWMGVPVLTLPGKIPVSRAGLSLLSSVGLGEFAASSEEDYVRIAVEQAGNLPRLAELRAALRARMQASPLMDAPRFARNVEAAYRSMWERWIEKQSSTRE